MAVAKCQCTKICNNIPLPHSPFCKEHEKRCSRISPLSGWEPKYDPKKYNKTRKIKDSHNCFAYAFDHIDVSDPSCTEKSCSIPFHQPGRASGYPKWSKVKGKRCPDLMSRLFGDVKELKQTTFEKKCPKYTSKIALVVDEDEDYHFYRQDSNGYWSHKPGSTNVTNVDANGRRIYDPELASRKYDKSGLNYDMFCSYMCTPRTKRLRLKRGGRRTLRRK